MTESEITTTVSKEATKDTTTVTLPPEQEQNLLAGIQTEATTDTDTNALEQLSDTLEGYQQNKQRQEAWIRQITLPDGQPQANAPVHIQFLLPSGDTFTETFHIPAQTYPDDNDLVQLLEETGHTPATITNLLGDSVNVTHQNNRWNLSLKTDQSTTENELSDTEQQTIHIVATTLLSSVVFVQFFLPLAIIASSPFLVMLPVILASFIVLTTIIYAILSTVDKNGSNISG